MKLYATGFNAWGQLSFEDPASSVDDPDDLHAFTCVLEDARIDSVRPLPTSTEVLTSRGTLVAGAPVSDAPRMPDARQLSAQALNGRFVVYDSKEGILRQYASVPKHGDGQRDEFSVALPHVVQLVAYDVGFAARTAAGAVWTWGDSRFPACLGRDVDGAAADAERPGLVTALAELPSGPIATMAAGGYVLAAVTRGQDMYCWGQYIGMQQHARVLEELTGDPEPVVGTTSDGEIELDVVDVGVGDAHMVILATDGRVYVVGSNANGQLGLGRAVASTAPSAWARVEGIPAAGQRVVGVYAGRKSSFIVCTS